MFEIMLQFVTFRVKLGMRFVFCGYLKNALNLFRMQSCRFLENETLNPLISFISGEIGSNLKMKPLFIYPTPKEICRL